MGNFEKSYCFLVVEVACYLVFDLVADFFSTMTAVVLNAVVVGRLCVTGGFVPKKLDLDSELNETKETVMIAVAASRCLRRQNCLNSDPLQWEKQQSDSALIFWISS